MEVYLPLFHRLCLTNLFTSDNSLRVDVAQTVVSCQCVQIDVEAGCDVSAVALTTRQVTRC